MRVLVGVGGWAYLPVEGDKLKACSRLYDFVEVNSTFYTYPSLSTVRGWRRRVPQEFEFTVKCHRDVTHRFRLRPRAETFRALRQMLMICSILEADILVLQTPPDLELGEDSLTAMRETLIYIRDEADVEVAWEVRPPRGSQMPLEVYELMEELDIIPVVDLSRFEAPKGDVVYSRIFGGWNAMSEEELGIIDARVRASSARRAYLCFHGARMYEDALRYIEVSGGPVASNPDSL